VHDSRYPFSYTHASFPKLLFDEVVDELGSHGRIAGRVGSAYIALWSAAGTASWVTSGTYVTNPFTLYSYIVHNTC
jgi:hypothetical protein